MKRFLTFLLPAVILFSCADNEKSGTDTATADSVSTTLTSSTNLNLPYTLDRTPDWERGDDSHVELAMNTLKAFESNDLTSLQNYLADSVEFYHDNLYFKGTKDSIINFFSSLRKTFDSMSVKMHDYESVRSKSRGENWVSLWYTETTKSKGKTDSMMVMDDIKIVNGKVAVIDSKMRRLTKRS